MKLPRTPFPFSSPASRRDFLRLVGVGAVTLPLAGLTAGCGREGGRRGPGDGGDTDPLCEPTNRDPYGLGPYYRAGAPDRGGLVPPGATGAPLAISGTIYATDCVTPLAGAVVEVWQADDGGTYDGESSEFWYRARLVTGTDGRYAFTSIYPGAYNLGARFRPHHIHYRVSHGDALLVTQLYFEGDPYLEDDPGDEPSRTIPLVDEDGVGVGVFDIVLASE